MTLIAFWVYYTVSFDYKILNFLFTFLQNKTYILSKDLLTDLCLEPLLWFILYNNYLGKATYNHFKKTIHIFVVIICKLVYILFGVLKKNY